jgi:predicted dehydrogenase
MASATYKVLIIGCGNIAGDYDLQQPEDAMPLGHAKAFLKHGGFKLAACVEPDLLKQTAFKQRWDVPKGYTSLNDPNLEVGWFDVISICSPTIHHAEHIKTALELKPKLIFCEKPVASSLRDSQRVVKECAEHQVLLAVNYSRRWSPQVVRLKEDLDKRQWGSVRSVSAVYNKGILHNGSHMLDLFICLFGSLQITSVGLPVYDFFSDDPSIDVTFRTNQGMPIQLNVSNAKDYTIFEMQIVTEKGVIGMEDGGTRWRFRIAKPSDQLVGYNFLDFGDWLVPQGSNALTEAMDNIFDALQIGAPLISNGGNAIQAMYFCEKIKQMALEQTTEHISKQGVI